MSVLKAVKILAIGILVLFLALFTFLWFTQLQFLKPRIERLVSEATGQEFRVDGAFSIDVLPRPTLVVERASLSSPDWGSEETMLSLGHARIQLTLSGLLQDPIHVERVEVGELHVLVEYGPEGQLNWQAPTKSTEPLADNEDDVPSSDAPLEPRLPVEVIAASLNDIQLRYIPPGEEAMTFAIDSLQIDKTDPEFSTLTVQALFAKLPIDLSAEVNRTHTSISGTIGELSLNSQYAYPDNKVNFKTRLSALATIGKMIEINNLPDEDLDLQGRVSIDGSQLLIEGFSATLSGLTLNLDASVDTETSNVEAHWKINGDSLTYLDNTLPELPYALEGNLNYQGDKVDLARFLANVGDSDLQGKASVTLSDIPTLTLKAESQKIDLSPFMADSHDTAPEEDTTSVSPEPSEPESSTQYVFTEAALPLELLDRVNADIHVGIDTFIAQGTQLKNINSEVSLDNGALVAHTSFSGMQGGRYENHLNVTHKGKDSEIRVETQAEQLRVGLLAGSDIDPDDIPPTNLDIQLRATGNTQRALASSLDGLILIQQGSGKVSNALIDRFSGDIIAQLFHALNPFAKDEAYSNWECSIIALDFQSGDGTVDGFLMQSDKLMVLGAGAVDLNDESLNFEFNTKPRKGVGVSADMFVTPFVKLSGTLAKPRVGLNKKGVLLSGGAAVLTGGMSFLYKGVMDRASAESGQCDKVMEQVTASFKALEEESQQ